MANVDKMSSVVSRARRVVRRPCVAVAASMAGFGRGVILNKGPATTGGGGVLWVAGGVGSGGRRSRDLGPPGDPGGPRGTGGFPCARGAGGGPPPRRDRHAA